MSQPPCSNNDTGDNTGVGPDREMTTGTPAWVKVFGVIALFVVLLFVILMFTRGPGARHGPGRHMRSGNTAGQTPAYSRAEGHMLSMDGDA